ncbi:MAG: hypothetical protein L0H79_18735 [Intrasporangium sp.]|uniref:hypothetical protein n=1 Tax=Intrasporangium sp. TaxID=1925024 RepID=UPI00264855F2|nr:hypothetical protein [Intrasporangium sp.]MDN5797764.1 hypothetical protein [Intrasporangium sp.]
MRMEQGLRWLIIAVAVGMFVPQFIGAVQTGQGASIVLFAAVVGSALLLFAFRLTSRLGAGLLLLGAWTAPMLEFTPGSNGPAYVLSIAVYVTMASFHVQTAMTLLGVCFAAFLAATMIVPGDSVWLSVDHVVVNLALAYAASICIAVLRGQVAQMDEARRAAIDQDLMSHFVAEEMRRREEARRILHDRVLATLLRIAEFGVIEPESLRRTISELGTATGEARPEYVEATTLVAVVDDVRVDHAVPSADMTLAKAQDWPPLRPDVAAAVARILGELVRNAKRHGDGGGITIAPSFSEGRFSVSVTNAQAAQGRQSGGWGWRNSVAAQVDALRGVVTRRRAHGRVVVTVSWPADRHEKARGAQAVYVETVGLSPTGFSRLMQTLWPVLCMHTYLAIRHTELTSFWAVQPIVVIALWLVTWTVLRQVTAGLPATSQCRVWGIVITAAVVASVVVAGIPSLRTFASWAIGMGSVPLVAIAFVSPPGRVAWLTLPLSAFVVIAVVTDPAVGLSAGAGAVAATLIPWVALAFGAVMRAMNRQAEAAEAMLHERVSTLLSRMAKGRSDEVLLRTRTLVLPQCP